jgi:hypothetical protein
MKIVQFSFWLVICWTLGASVALGADPVLPTPCELTQAVDGKFSAGMATYFLAGKCQIGSSSTTWSASVVYEHGRFREDTLVGSGGQQWGTIQSISRMPCADDPWLSQVKCEVETKKSTNVPGGSMSLWLEAHFYPRIRQYKPFSATFNYDRGPLLAKRDADLKAEVRRLGRSNQPVPLITVIAPTILAPAANALFLSNTSVPIKIAPPQGLTVTLFTVKIESRNAQGLWTLVTNLPVGPAEASSPSGYMGWGAPGNGRGAAMIAGPGTYRVSAQVSAPRQTGWSTPIEFVVTAPKKAIQKGPKMFGP